MVNKRILLAARPVGMPKESDFRIVSEGVETMAAGDVLVEILYLSVDPYMRGRMSEAKSYAPPVRLGEIMPGGTVGRVVHSNASEFRKGDIVVGMLGWQQFALVTKEKLTKIDPTLAPISTALGVLGMPGMTAYFGLLDICQPKAGETVVISGAAGAVGSYVGQIAKIQGCRVVGIAGNDEKIQLLKSEFGFDDAFNYKTTADYSSALGELCSNGIDCYFDNVGGPITDAVFGHLNDFSRVAICGQISQYNSTKPEMGPRLLMPILIHRVKVQGFLVGQFAARAKEAIVQLARWVGEGKLKYQETIVEGFENAPRALIGLLNGENTGKMLVKVAD